MPVDRDLYELRRFVEGRKGLDLFLVPGLLEALRNLVDVLGTGKVE